MQASDQAGSISCPCGSGDELALCCGHYHAGTPAPSAERLMRSRYSAYVLGLIDYLKATTLPVQQAALDLESMRQWSANSIWLGLEIEQSAPRLLQVGFGFDDNIVRLRDTVNPLALNEEDLFTEFLLSGQDKLDAEGTWRSDVALLGRSYANSRAADDYTALGGLTRTVELNEDWLALPRVSQSFSYIGDDAYLSTSAARLQLASSRWRLYYEGAWLASLSEIFDGYEGHRHQLSATRLWRTGDAAYGAGYTYEYNDRELDLLSPQRHRLLLSSEFVLDAERSIEGVLRYTFSDYEADREDNELQGTLRLNRRLTRDLILLTEYRYVRYDSSIDFIDYRQNVFYTALVTEF